MKLRIILVGLCVVVLSAVSFVSCKSVPKNDPNFLGDYPPILVDTILVNTFTQGKNVLTPREVKFVFYPNGNAMELRFRYSMNNVIVTFIQQDREKLITAMEKYIAEYQAGKLVKANNKKKAFFGKVDAFLMWGLLAPATYAKPTMRFEYQLAENNKPYFVIGNTSAPETNEEGYLIKDGANSPAIRLALSPIQCQRVIEIMKQENLVKMVENFNAEAAQFDLETESLTDEEAEAAAAAEPQELF